MIPKVSEGRLRELRLASLTLWHSPLGPSPLLAPFRCLLFFQPFSSALKAQKTPRWLSELQAEGLLESTDQQLSVQLCTEACLKGDLIGAELWFRRASAVDKAAAESLWDAVGRCLPYATVERLLDVAGTSLAARKALLRAAARACDLEKAERWASNGTVDQPLRHVTSLTCPDVEASGGISWLKST